MSLVTAARFARRELRAGLRGFRIFLACLTLGVAAIAAVGSVRSSIEAGLEREGAAILGGAAELEFSYRFASDVERAWIDNTGLTTSEIVDFRSMAVVTRNGETERALTQIKAIDDAYPLVGTVVLTPNIPLEQALAGHEGLPGAVMKQVLMDRLALSVGDIFSLGTQDFILMAALTKEPDSGSSGFTLGPRTIVATTTLEKSGLISPGSLYSTKYRMTLPPESDLDGLQVAAEAALPDAGFRWRDARNGAPNIARFVERLGAFLVLVGLSGLAVGGVGVSAAVRAYLAGKTNVIATLRTLGADRSTIFQTYFLQIGALSLVGITFGVVLGGAIPIALGPLLSERLPIPADFTVHLAPLAEAAVYGVLTALIFTLWPLSRIGDIRAATLFRDALSAGKILPPWRYLVVIIALIGALLAVAVWFSGSAFLTLWTAGSISGALALLAASALAITYISRKTQKSIRGRPALRWALGAIGATRGEATSVVLSLGLGLSVLATVGQIDGNLRDAISRDLPEVAPSYFFIDIQEDQMPAVQKRLDEDPAVTRVQSAPMLRGRVTYINGRPASEVAGDHWVVHSDRGITYAAQKPETTRLTEGAWWPQDYSGPPLLSFAAEEAAEMGLSLNDEITVNILGRDIVATIANLREVDFSSAEMGFVMTLNPSAVAGAPHSFIATVYADEASEAAILRDIANAFPNITAIRVRDAIDQVSGVLTSLAAAISYGAAATLLTGFLVLIGAAAAGEQSRTYEAAVLKTLGASRGRILTSFALRSALLGGAAAIVALAAGIAGGWAVSNYVMETEFVVIWSSALAIVIGGVLATLTASLAFAWRPLTARPAQVLRAKE